MLLSLPLFPSFFSSFFFSFKTKTEEIGKEEKGNTQDCHIPPSRQHIQPHWPFRCEDDGAQFPVVAEDCCSILLMEAVIVTWSSSVVPLGASERRRNDGCEGINFVNVSFIESFFFFNLDLI